LPIFVKVCVPRSGTDRHSGEFNLVRKLLIALFLATLTFGLTATAALAGGGGMCCYS
jgi:hypothetical protein